MLTADGKTGGCPARRLVCAPSFTRASTVAAWPHATAEYRGVPMSGEVALHKAQHNTQCKRKGWILERLLITILTRFFLRKQLLAVFVHKSAICRVHLLDMRQWANHPGPPPLLGAHLLMVGRALTRMLAMFTPALAATFSCFLVNFRPSASTSAACS